MYTVLLLVGSQLNLVNVREKLLLDNVLYCSSQSVLIVTTMKSLLTQPMSMATMNAYKGFL